MDYITFDENVVSRKKVKKIHKKFATIIAKNELEKLLDGVVEIECVTFSKMHYKNGKYKEYNLFYLKNDTADCIYLQYCAYHDRYTFSAKAYTGLIVSEFNYSSSDDYFSIKEYSVY